MTGNLTLGMAPRIPHNGPGCQQQERNIHGDNRNVAVIWHVLTHNADWSDAGGVYIFTGVNPTTNRWIPYYVGQTGSFRDRIPSHEKWPPAVLLGATHVHARVVRKRPPGYKLRGS